MLFNSIEFLFIFLPLVLAGWFLLGRARRLTWNLGWLFAASLAFYGYWNPIYLILLIGSVAFNFVMGLAIHRHPRRALVTLGVLVDLSALGYFKYANFFVDNLNVALGTDFFLAHVVLPLGISFFTLTQIAYLFDVYRGHRPVSDPVGYGLFVSFFPHLLAGPLLHHTEMMPQFQAPRILTFSPRNFAVGVTLFAFALFKKVVIADNLPRYSEPVFAAAARGEPLTMLEAWGGSLAFFFQIYFDVAAYSEMALALALMLNLRLPINVFSPIKAQRISEIWSRLHISIWRFMRDYWFLPLALRDMHKHPWHRYRHMFSAMVINGLWHGANWMYMWWGVANGILMMLDRGWEDFRRRHGLTGLSVPFLGQALTIGLFFTAGILFRASDLPAAGTVFKGLLGFNGLWRPLSPVAPESLLAPVDTTLYSLMPTLHGHSPIQMSLVLVVLGAICLFSPNAIELTWRFKVGLNQRQLKPLSRHDGRFVWRPSRPWAVVMGLVAAFAIANLSKATDFLYFQF